MQLRHMAGMAAPREIRNPAPKGLHFPRLTDGQFKSPRDDLGKIVLSRYSTDFCRFRVCHKNNCAILVARPILAASRLFSRLRRTGKRACRHDCLPHIEPAQIQDGTVISGQTLNSRGYWRQQTVGAGARRQRAQVRVELLLTGRRS